MHEDKKEENHDNDLSNIKAKLMLDWVDKFSCLYCVHLRFSISIDERNDEAVQGLIQ